MAGWCGIALALRSPEEDALASRLPTYLHPLAGRSLCWHVVQALTAIEPDPSAVITAATPELARLLAGELPARIVVPESADGWWSAVESELPPDAGRILAVDAAAAALREGLASMVSQERDTVLRGAAGDVVALWCGREAIAARAAGGDPLRELAAELPEFDDPRREESFVIRDRADLARAGGLLRDRIVSGLMARGVSFLLPSSVLVDVDVRVGQDSVIYPGVVLEGRTEIGAETVIGPSCRIVDSHVGSGVELKGWNYVVRTRIRNRAVLEPYVRRGFE